MINKELNYKKFIKYLKSYIHRDGIDSLILWLDKTDAQVAPASTKYHLSCESGLIQHSLNVFMRLISLIGLEYPPRVDGKDKNDNDIIVDTCPYSKETIALVALLHDISKVGYYKKYFRNVQNEETGRWEKVMSYTVKDEEDRLLYATHEENSVYILSKFLKLTYDEELAIRYHMGNIDSDDTFVQNRMISAYKRSPLALLLHMADMQAMCLDEVADGSLNDVETSKENKEEVKVDTEVVEEQKNEVLNNFNGGIGDERDTETATVQADNEVSF